MKTAVPCAGLCAASLLVSAAFGPRLPAQELSVATRGPFLSTSDDLTPTLIRRLLALDVDGDGDLDLWEAGIVHRNDGRARFTRQGGAVIPALIDAAVTEVLVDGNPDLVVQTSVGPKILVNRGGRLIDETDRAFPSDQLQRFRFGDALLVDYDGDGDRDLVMVNRTEDAAFTLDRAAFQPGPMIPFRRDPATGIRLEGNNHTATAVGDFDNDGFDDFVLASGGTTPWAAIAGGPQGNFRNESTTWLSPFTLSRFADSAVGDFDGDGATDIALLQTGNGALLMLRNEIAQGNGFVDVTPRWRPSVFALTDFAAHDLDGDGDAELVVRNEDGVFLLDLAAAGGFVVAQGPLPDTARRPARLFDDGSADLDGDGHRDLFFEGGLPFAGRRAQLWLGQGGLQVAANGVTREIRSGNVFGAMLFADLDGDGDDDAVVNDPNQTLVQRNDGRGGFSPFGPDVPANLERAVAGDVDRDGDLDLVVALTGGRRRVMVNDGSGRLQFFAPPINPDAAFRSYDLDLVDVDGDGQLDLLCANQGQDQLFLGQPGLAFQDATSSRLPVDVQLTTRMLPLDFDGDGDLDLHVSSGFEGGGVRPDRFWINQGGRFTAAPAGTLPASATSWTSLATDFDGDGDVDVVAVGASGLQFLENDGAGSFRLLPPSSAFPGLPLVNRLHAGDLDADGDLDLFVLENLNRLRALRRDGTIGYRLVDDPVVPGQLTSVTSPVFHDLDGDGDTDLVCRDGVLTPVLDPVRVLLNRTRQIESLFPTRLGQTLELDFTVLEQGAAVGGLAWPVFAPALAATPQRIPGLGTLRLDPNQLIVEAPVFLGTGTAAGILRLPVPVQPALVGVAVHAQAVIAPRGALPQARLSSLVTTELVH